MARIGRRKLLQLSGAGAIAARTGGISAVLALGKAPAYAQGTSVHWLRWNDFVPASDKLLRDEIIPECAKALGVKLNIEMINGNDIQARTTSAIQSGSGPDVICALNNWPQLYAESVVDVSDIADAIGKAQGGYYEESRVVANDGKRWIALPWCVLGAQISYRKSWFEEAGYSKFPQTWDEYHDAGKKLKAKGRPFGQAVSHSFGDPPTFVYPLMWSFGGKEVEADGKTVVLNSKATVDSVKFMTAAYKDAFDEGGLAWDDSSNNRAFLAGTISATLNGASIYLEAKRKPDTYMTEKGTPLFQDILHAPLPKGAAGQFGYHLPMSNMLMRYSQNQKPAKEFLKWITSKEVYRKWFDSQQGYSVGSTTTWEEDPLWKKDPVMLPFRSAARAGRFPGYAGPADQKAAEVLSKYIIVDMYAKAIQGTPAEEVVKAAHEEVLKIHRA
ncbi:MAG TPA: extracellular solute-binding protein [Stellaceae bacterium]|nr:extracellular solute-binding protein [Stellaceae bacterium]